VARVDGWTIKYEKHLKRDLTLVLMRETRKNEELVILRENKSRKVGMMSVERWRIRTTRRRGGFERRHSFPSFWRGPVDNIV